MENVNDTLLIRYEYDASVGINMHLLGESLIGFDAVLNEFIEIARLKDKVRVKVNRIEEGSVEVYSSLEIISLMPFDSVPHLIEFLKLAEPGMVNIANTFFSATSDTVDALDAFYREHAFQAMLTSALMPSFASKCFKLAGKIHKGAKLTQEDQNKATPRQIGRLKRMVWEGKYRRALAPVVEGTAKSIEMKALKANDSDADNFVDESNVGDYLPKSDEILSQFRNGDRVTVIGQLLELSSTKGDEMQIKAYQLSRRHNLLRCVPADGVDFVDYGELYKKNVKVDAEVVRTTMYKKPTLVVSKVELLQLPMVSVN